MTRCVFVAKPEIIQINILHHNIHLNKYKINILILMIILSATHLNGLLQLLTVTTGGQS